MEGLKAWAKELAAIVILGGLLELVIPAGAMRRYAHLAVGLLILLTVLGPVLTLAQDPSDLLAALAGQAAAGAQRDDRVAAVRAQMDRHAREVFLARVQEAAAATAREAPGVADVQVRAALLESGPRPGEPPAVRLAIEVVAAPGAQPDDLRRQVLRRVAERLHMAAEQIEVNVRRGQQRAPVEGGRNR